MYNLIKSELLYYKVILIILSIFLFTLHLFFLVYGADNLESSVPAVKVTIIATTIILCVFRNITFYKDKRDKIFICLPIDAKNIGVARLLILPIFWIYAISLFLLFNLLIQSSNIGVKFFSEVISLSGIVLFFNSAAIIYLDFIFSGLSRKKTFIIKLTGIFLAASIYLSFFILMPIAENFGIAWIQNLRTLLYNFSQTIFGAIIILFIGAFSILISSNIFSKRKSYLNQ